MVTSGKKGRTMDDGHSQASHTPGSFIESTDLPLHTTPRMAAADECSWPYVGWQGGEGEQSGRYTGVSLCPSLISVTQDPFGQRHQSDRPATHVGACFARGREGEEGTSGIWRL